MYRTILVPIDGSTFAEHALPAALALARHSGGTLRLITVSTPLVETSVEGLYFSAAEVEEDIVTRYRANLEGIAARLRQRTAGPIVTDVLHGDIGPTLCGEIDKSETDLVVMATHGRGAFERFWLGSNTDDVIRHSSKPVLLVRPEEGPVDLAAEPRFSPALVSLDGTAFAETVLDHAVKLVGLSSAAELILVRAIQGVAPTSAAPDVEEARREADNIRRQVRDLQSHLRQEAKEYLEGVAGRLRSRGLTVRTHVVTGDQPAQAILEEARSSGAGLIALETHGRAGLTRLLVGSVADKVIRAATVPVLVHRRSG